MRLLTFQLFISFVNVTSHSLTCLGTPERPRYSRLRQKSTYMDEKEAEILDHCLTGIVEVAPLIGVLENVYGLLTVWPEVGLEYSHSIMNLSLPKCLNWKGPSCTWYVLAGWSEARRICHHWPLSCFHCKDGSFQDEWTSDEKASLYPFDSEDTELHIWLFHLCCMAELLSNCHNCHWHCTCVNMRDVSKREISSDHTFAQHTCAALKRLRVDCPYPTPPVSKS